MSRPLCSVVMATFDRWKYLWRSLECYRNQDFDNARFELVVIDDHSTDGTRENVLDWAKTSGIRTTVLTVAPKPGVWVDCGWVLNSGIRAAAGAHILLTHPEVMPGRKSVAACVGALQEFENASGRRYPLKKDGSGGIDMTGPIIGGLGYVRNIGLYACCPVYYMGPQDQDRIDTVDWKGRGAGTVREIEGFYTDDVNGHPDYSHRATELIGTKDFHIKTWESFVFSGMSRETWKRMGGLQETHRWGSVDCAWMLRRRALGIPSAPCIGPDCVVTHQFHGGTERDEAGWRQELDGINWQDRAKLVYPEIDFLGW